MQTTTDRFHQLASGSVIPIDWNVLMSFTKRRRDDLDWFTLDVSELDGDDILATLDDNPTQVWDAYEWLNISDKIIDMRFERSIRFPYNVQAASAEVHLSNTDHFFTHTDRHTALSPIGEYILPKRPLRLFLGMRGETNLPQFVGLTQTMPNYSDDGTTLRWSALDFLTEIGDLDLRSVIMMRDARTDQVIAAILEQFGMTPEQYSLSPANNTIPFVLFDSGMNAGNALRRLVQAENGALWLDEQGIIRFTTRAGVLGKHPVMYFDKKNIIDIKPSRHDRIINTVKIRSDIRVVQPFQTIFSMDNNNGYSRPANDDQWRVPANSTMKAWLSFEDPAWTTANLVFNGANTSSWFTAKSLAGQAITSGVNANGTLFQNSYKIVFTNSNSQPVSIDELELWGEPARVVDTIVLDVAETNSVEKYGIKKLEITDNNFFGSYANADAFAFDILTKHSGFSNSIEMTVKGNPALQVSDVITVGHKYAGDYIITGISVRVSAGMMETIITADKHEVVEPFILDISQLDGEDRLG